MRHAITVTAALAGAALMALVWFGSSQAQVFQAVTKVCTTGFTASGTNNSYSCTSGVFKCRAGLQILLTRIQGGNRAYYVCGTPAG